ncbi:MAG: hypothetical protein AB1847_15625 [bacterium]
MKKVLVMMAALLIFAGFSTFAQGQNPTSETPAKEAMEQTITAEPKAEVLAGSINSLNLEMKTLMLKVNEASGEVEKKIAVDLIDQSTLSTLKAGDQVKVTLKAGEEMRAEKVEVMPKSVEKVKARAKGRSSKGGANK